MIEILFKIDGSDKKEMAVFETIKEMKSFLKTFKEEFLKDHPTATDISLGKMYVGI